MTILEPHDIDGNAADPSEVLSGNGSGHVLDGTYGTDAPIYLNRGITNVIPIPLGRKSPPPEDFTGNKNGDGHKVVTVEQAAEWQKSRSDWGCGFVLDDGQQAVDVDNYAKGDRPAGAAVRGLIEIEERTGCKYPPTAALYHRDDGSAKYFYRCTPGVGWRGGIATGVEIVSHDYRYVHAGINPDTGKQQLWGWGSPTTGITATAAGPIPPDQWTALSEPLQAEHAADDNGKLVSLATDEQAQKWLSSMPEGPMSHLVRERLNRALADLSGRNGSRHDCTRHHVRQLVQCGAAGLLGAEAALGILERELSELRKVDSARASDVGEFDRLLPWAAKRCRPDLFHALQCLDRNGGRVRITREADKAAADGSVTRSLADVTPTKVEWLWRPWIPRGKVSILEGEPDVGKSLLTLTMASLVSQGDGWPESIVDGEVVTHSSADAAGVVLVGIEDDDADTVVPRLIAAGADLTQVHVMNQPHDDKGNPVPFVIPDDVNRLRQAISETDAKLVVVDPITAFLSTSKVKAGDDPSTRQALMPLVTLAAETGCAIVLVRHLNKATGMSAKNRGSGTIAYTGITRSVIIAGKLKEPSGEATHAIALTKGNLTKDPMALAYRIDSAPDDTESPIIEWCGPIDLNADQLVGADGAKVSDARKHAPVRDEAKSILREVLHDGPMRQKDAMRITKETAGCGIKTVREAAKELRVIHKSVYVDKKIDHWTWELPPKPALRIVADDDAGEPDES